MYVAESRREWRKSTAPRAEPWGATADATFGAYMTDPREPSGASQEPTTASLGLSGTGAERAESSLVDGEPVPLAGGQLLAAISTRIVANMREHYGRGPMSVKTHAFDDVVVLIMREIGFTTLEKTIMEAGEPNHVIAMREDFQRSMAAAYKESIKQLTGRNVLAFLSKAHVNPDIIVEIFFIDGPLPGVAATKITKPGLDPKLRPGPR
jgi:uncharacterized protein YbcI